MLSFAKILRIHSRSVEVFQRLREVAVVEARDPQQAVCPDILTRHQTFAAFPGMKASAKKDFQRFSWLTGLVVERHQFYGQIISLGDEIRAILEESQALHGRNPYSFPQLIQFIKDAGVLRVFEQRSLIGIERPLAVVTDVEICNAKVSPGNRKSIVDLNTLFPQGNSIFVALLVVVEISQVVQALGVRRVFQELHFLEPRWKAIVGGCLRSQCSIFSGQLAVARQLRQKVVNHGIGRRRWDRNHTRQQRQSLWKETRGGIVECEIQVQLAILVGLLSKLLDSIVGVLEQQQFEAREEIQGIFRCGVQDESDGLVRPL